SRGHGRRRRPHRALRPRGRAADSNPSGGDRQPVRPLPERVRAEHGHSTMTLRRSSDSARDIAEGRTSLGIELGSTRIKACLIGPNATDVLATGSSSWENSLEDGVWTYGIDEVWQGLQSAFAALVDDA